MKINKYAIITLFILSYIVYLKYLISSGTYSLFVFMNLKICFKGTEYIKSVIIN